MLEYVRLGGAWVRKSPPPLCIKPVADGGISLYYEGVSEPIHLDVTMKDAEVVLGIPTEEQA